MTDVFLLGAGAVAASATRQLLDSPEINRVLVASKKFQDARELASAFGTPVEPIQWRVGELFPENIQAIALTVPPGDDLPIVQQAIDQKISVATTTDDDTALRALIGLDESAKSTKTSVAVGCGLAPGLADVLAHHAADGLEDVTEVHIARIGTAGPTSIQTTKNALSERAKEWRDGEWHVVKNPGPALEWFPDPIGGRECVPSALGTALLARDFPKAYITARLAELPPSWERFTKREEEWGGLRVEVWGTRGAAREGLIYGLVERPAVATGTALAVATLFLTRGKTKAGVHSLGELARPVDILQELLERGVKAAAFEGMPVA